MDHPSGYQLTRTCSSLSAVIIYFSSKERRKDVRRDVWPRTRSPQMFSCDASASLFVCGAGREPVGWRGYLDMGDKIGTEKDRWTDLKTSPNLSDTRIVWLSLANFIPVGFLGSSLHHHTGEFYALVRNGRMTCRSLRSFSPSTSHTFSFLSSPLVAR
jgi:hypothetical protein